MHRPRVARGKLMPAPRYSLSVPCGHHAFKNIPRGILLLCLPGMRTQQSDWRDVRLMSAFGGKAERRNIATDGLNGKNIPTARGGAWSATQVMRVLKRLTA